MSDLEECGRQLAEAGVSLEKLWAENKALKDENSRKRRAIVMLLDTLSDIENIETGCPPIIVDVIHKALSKVQT